MSKRNRGNTQTEVIEEQIVEQPEELTETAEINWNDQSDDAILTELDRRILSGADKNVKSGRIRELGRMGLKIRRIQKVLKLNAFQHAYVVLRKAGLVTPTPRTERGKCIVCGKPIYTDEAVASGMGLLCRSAHAKDEGAELEEEEQETEVA